MTTQTFLDGRLSSGFTRTTNASGKAKSSVKWSLPSMSCEWMNMVGPADYEPDYDAYIAELESLEENMARVATYNDWFVGEE